MLQIVRQTWQERYNMYMQCTKEQLASMLAEQTKYICPEQCAEFAPMQDAPIDMAFYTVSYEG